MEYIKRNIIETIKVRFFSGKVLIIVGPRQVGKTTLSETVLADYEHEGKRVLRLNCDNPTDRTTLTDRDLSYLKEVVGTADIVFIDEGQKVSSIGQTLKLLVDFYKTEKQILVTGSSSFNLLDQTQEALTGRKRVFHLYPIAISELYRDHDFVATQKALPVHLVYGLYPEVVRAEGFEAKRESLTELSTSQLYQDILEFQAVKDSTVLHKLLKALALQVGSEVSYSELGSLVGVDKNTVERYVDLLEKAFVVFRLPPYFTNKRTEIKKHNKVYFYDVGIRNAVIQNFNPLDMRNDVGALFENFLMAERLKKNAYGSTGVRMHFWRTYEQQEVDLVEETDGALTAYEFKWSAGRSVAPPPAFTRTYPDASFDVVTSEKYLGFVA
jgi:uncharacterized protein